MTAPVAPPPPVATAPTDPGLAAIQAQNAAVAGTSTTAAALVAAYLLQADDDEEAWYGVDWSHQIAKRIRRDVDGPVTVNTARFMDDFMADAVAHFSGKAFKPIGVRKTVGVAGERGVRTGVKAEHVYGRAAGEYRYQQSVLDRQFVSDVAARLDTPTPLAAPLDVAIGRASRAAQLNVALAARNQASATLKAAADRDLIIGYRRVLHPELARGGDCGLCIADSTRIFKADHLMALHPGCHCVPLPVTRTSDPGAAINDADLGRIYGDAHGDSAAKLRSTRYRVDEHGEVGPVLRPADEPIRTAAQARRAAGRTDPKTPAEQARTLRNRRDELARSYAQMTAGATPDAWKARLDGVAARIAKLDRQIVKLGG